MIPPPRLSAVVEVARVVGAEPLDLDVIEARLREVEADLFAAKHGLTLLRGRLRPSRVTLRNVRTGIARAYGLRRSRVRVALAPDGGLSVTVRHARGVERWFPLTPRDASLGAWADAEVHRPRRAS